MFSAGMFSALAARIAVRSRGLPSGSPPPPFAAIEISLMRRVNILPRLASVAPFLCLMVAHFEWPDMSSLATLDFAIWLVREPFSAQNTTRRKPQATVDFSTAREARVISANAPHLLRLLALLLPC